MQIVYGVNSSYLFPALVSIYSIWKVTSQPVAVTIYGEGFNSADSRKVGQVKELLQGKVEITLEEFDSGELQQFSGFKDYRTNYQSPLYPNVTLLPLILPRLVEDRCLFLDADTLIVEDPNDLLGIDLHGYPIGGVPDVAIMSKLPRLLIRRVSDIFTPTRTRRIRDWELQYYLSLGFVPTTKNLYFNAGVLLMDCKAIRKLYPNREYSSIEGLRPFFDNLPEQDRLNQLFRGNVYRLPLEWNISPYLIKSFHRLKLRNKQTPAFVFDQIKEATNNPKIWHYMGGLKPWEIKIKRGKSHPGDAFQRHASIRQELEFALAEL